MKIVVLGTRGFPNVQGGVETHCEQLYPRMVANGNSVSVLARQRYVGNRVTFYKGITIHPLPSPNNKFLEAFVHTFIGVVVAKILMPDILHIHAVGPSLFVPLAKMLGLKVVMTHHGMDYKRAKWNFFARAVLKKGEAWGCRKADAVICVSEQIAEEVRSKFKREVKFIPNGVVLPKILTSHDILIKYGLEEGKYILAVGRFVPEKGFDYLLSAFQNLDNNWKLIIVGDADHKDGYSKALRNRARKVVNVVLTGFLGGQPLAELYSHAGLFVLPSYHEGLSIVLLEALSYGLSCIASDIPANRNLSLSEERYFTVGDADALVIKMREFVDRPLSEKEREAQINMIARNYDWHIIAAKTLQIYQSI